MITPIRVIEEKGKLLTSIEDNKKHRDCSEQDSIIQTLCEEIAIIKLQIEELTKQVNFALTIGD